MTTMIPKSLLDAAGHVSKSITCPACGDHVFQVDEIEKLISKNVAGDICMQFYDEDGNTSPFKEDNNVVGIDIHQLKKVPHSIGIAGGTDKLSAIRGAIKGRYINTLITDISCAQALLEQPHI